MTIGLLPLRPIWACGRPYRPAWPAAPRPPRRCARRACTSGSLAGAEERGVVLPGR